MLETERLQLRAFRPDDAAAFQALAGQWDVARMTSDIPHPLSLDDAAYWLLPAADEARFALLQDGAMIGGAGYFLRQPGAAEFGFWLGRPYWGRGFATEAVKTVLAHALAHSSYPVFSSSHFTDNPASGRVLAKLGFEAVGTGRIWSIARGGEVTAICYQLTRQRAETLIDSAAVMQAKRFPTPMLRLPLPQSGRWSSLIGRLTRSA